MGENRYSKKAFVAVAGHDETVIVLLLLLLLGVCLFCPFGCVSIPLLVVSIYVRRNRLDSIQRQNLRRGLSQGLRKALNDASAQAQVRCLVTTSRPWLQTRRGS